MRELHVQPCSAALVPHMVDVVGAAPTASSVWARRSAGELHVVLLQVVARRAGTPGRTEIRGVKARSVCHYLIPALLVC
jgi:hypothetical protein